VGVVIGTCMVVLMISLGIAQNQANDEMIQSWGDLTQIQIYGGGISVGSDGKAIKLDDAALTQIRELNNVLAATPFTNPYNLQGTISAGRNGRYVSDIGNITALDPVALEPMGFALESGRWLDTTVINAQSKKIPVLVCEYTGYNFYDSRRSDNSPKRYRWQGQTDANGNELPPFVDVDKDKMTLTITNGDNTNPNTQTWELEVVGKLQQDVSKGWWTQGGIIMSMQNLKVIEAAYNKMAKIKDTNSSYDQVYVKVDDLKNVGDVEEAIHDLGFQSTWSSNQQREDMQKQVFRSQMIFGGVAAVSLLDRGFLPYLVWFFAGLYLWHFKETILQKLTGKWFILLITRICGLLIHFNEPPHHGFFPDDLCIGICIGGCLCLHEKISRKFRIADLRRNIFFLQIILKRDQIYRLSLLKHFHNTVK